MGNMNERLVIVPTYNEIENIDKIVEVVLGLPIKVHLLIVDDNSPDGTGTRIKELQAKHTKSLHLLERSGKLGLGTAYIKGFFWALERGYQYICEMDADFSHDTKYIKDLIGASKYADLVIGSRYKNGVRVNGWRFRRLLLSKFANMFVSYILVRPVWDFTAGFRCYRRSVLESIDFSEVQSDGYAFQIEMTYLTFKNNFKIYEVPIIFKERRHGYSKISR